MNKGYTNPQGVDGCEMVERREKKKGGKSRIWGTSEKKKKKSKGNVYKLKNEKREIKREREWRMDGWCCIWQTKGKEYYRGINMLVALAMIPTTYAMHCSLNIRGETPHL